MIPLIDLSLTRKSGEYIFKDVRSVITSKNFVLGDGVRQFESKYAQFLKAKFAIGVGSGTDALRLSLRAAGIGQGDKVLTVAFTSPFTVIAIIEEGAIPIFCDIREDTWTIDVEDAERKIDGKTKAIIPVHIYGNPCDMDSIQKLCSKNKLKLIEDACQAHGAEYKGKKVGTFGIAAAFSFYPTKNLGAFGDGGMITTNNKFVANKIHLLRHGGQTRRFWHEYSGINSRLDEIQAVILLNKLKNLNKNNKKRELIVKKYRQAFSELPITVQKIPRSGVSSNHLFVIRTNKRDKLQKFLIRNNISSDIYYHGLRIFGVYLFYS